MFVVSLFILPGWPIPRKLVPFVITAQRVQTHAASAPPMSVKNCRPGRLGGKDLPLIPDSSCKRDALRLGTPVASQEARTRIADQLNQQIGPRRRGSVRVERWLPAGFGR